MKEKPKFDVAPMVKDLLDKVKKRVLTKDRDFVLCIDGEEGVGKSVLAQQIGKYLDPNLSIDNIVFTADDFLNKIKDPSTKKGDCIILDEAFSAANSRASLTEVNRSMVGTATEMRQKNLFIILVLPSFFDLDRYFALWRCRGLIHVYFTPEDDRHYIIFPKEEKKLLYLSGKKLYNYSYPRSPFPAFRFPKGYIVDEEEYRKKKAQAFSKREGTAQSTGWLAQRNSYIKYLLEKYKLSQTEVGKVPERYGNKKVSQIQVSRILNEGRVLPTEE